MQAEFEPEATEQAVAYVKSFGYVNDERYVRNYIECRREQKSRRQIEQELLYKKGVPKDLIRQVYEELEPADERELIRRFLEKKHYCGASADEKKKRSVMASLARKGFSAEDILAVMREEQ